MFYYSPEPLNLSQYGPTGNIYFSQKFIFGKYLTSFSLSIKVLNIMETKLNKYIKIRKEHINLYPKL